MLERLRRLLPRPETLRHSRWLRWLGPTLQHPRLWHMSRRGIALGMALGVFFGMLIPVAQIPVAAAAAVILRANVPTAIASTLVTNPVTFGPLYYAAWRVGGAILGEPTGAARAPPPPDDELQVIGDEGWVSALMRHLRNVGRPLLLGLLIMASALGVLTYLLVSGLWYLKVSWTWRNRRRRSPRGDGGGDGR